jgi:hypothetical protein
MQVWDMLVEKEKLENAPRQLEAREASREDPKPLALHKQPMQGDGTPLHDGESECKLESRKVQPFNHGKSIKKKCKASPKRDEHPKGGGKTFSPHQLAQRITLKGMESMSTPMFSSIMRRMAM